MKNYILILGMVLAFPLLSDDSPTETGAKIETPKTATTAEVGDKAYTGDALKIKNRMDGLFEASKKVNAKGPEKAKSRGAIEGAMDWDRVAEVCLGSGRWKTESASNKSQFRNLLKDVIVRTAFTRMDKFWADGTTYDLSKIDVKAGGANVVSKFNVKNDSFALEYFMNKKAGEWLIWDISYEGERYSVNINEQIDAFLKEKGFANLLEKLRKRKADLDSDNKKG